MVWDGLIPDCIYGFLQALCSEITIGRLREHYRASRIKPGLDVFKASALPYSLYFFYSTCFNCFWGERGLGPFQQCSEVISSSALKNDSLECLRDQSRTYARQVPTYTLDYLSSPVSTFF